MRASFGIATDPMVGKSIGGVVVFGGGLALYDDNGIVGGLGVSGDSSCADHNVAWRVRAALGLDKVPAGVNPLRKDAIVYDLDPKNKSASGWGHPLCAGTEADIARELGAGVGGSFGPMSSFMRTRRYTGVPIHRSAIVALLSARRPDVSGGCRGRSAGHRPTCGSGPAG